MKKTLYCLLALYGGSIGGLTSAGSAHADELPALDLNVQQITVSGLSSGGFMATQMHVAWADWVSGTGVLAAGPWYCARNSLQTALQECLNQTTVDINTAAIEAQRSQWQESGKVAALSDMATDRVWVLHGANDQRLSRHVASALAQQYQQWLSQENLKLVLDKPFAHHFPTTDSGTGCSESAPPFLGNCGFDAAGELLTHIAGPLNPPSQKPSGTLWPVDQHARAGDAGGSLAAQGYLYVPESCASGAACQVHVSFHGCNQFATAPGVDNQYATRAGFNRWADSNHMVVLYPQIKASALSPFNPQGCWDWWGYTGPDYATREGLQLKAIRKLVFSFSRNQQEYQHEQ